MANLSNEFLAAWVLQSLPDEAAREVQQSAERDPVLASKLLTMQLMCGVPPSPGLVAAAQLESPEVHEASQGREQVGEAHRQDTVQVDPFTVRNLIAELLERELQNEEAVPLLRNRDVIEECRGLLLADVKPTRDCLLEFYEVAAIALGEALGDLARTALAEEGSDLPKSLASETLQIVSDETSLALSAARPARMLRRSERLRELTEFAPEDAMIYRLSMFAGRTVEEVAELLSRETPHVEEALAAAVTEVHLDDDQQTRNLHDS